MAMNAEEIIKEVSQYPSLDELLRRLPPYDRSTRKAVIERLREARAALIAKKEAKETEKEEEDQDA